MNKQIVSILTATVAILVLAIGAGAFVISYDALYAIGQSNGIPTGKAWIWPLLIDAPLIVFTLALLVSQIMQQSAKLWASLVILYTLATIGFNLSHAQVTPLGWTVAVVAPVGLLLTTEALRHLAKTIIERQAIVSSMSELSAACEHLVNHHAELEAQADKTNAAIEQKQHQLDVLKADILQAKSDNSTILQNKLQASKQQKIDERRQEVLTLLQEGYNEKDIAEQLERDVRTIRSDITALQTSSVFDRIVTAAIEDGKPGIADILTTAKRGWDRVNGKLPEGEVTQ